MSDAVVLANDLRPAGPLERLDRAIVIVRHGGLGLATRGWFGGAIAAFALLAAFFVVRVERAPALRLPAAALIVAAFLARSWLASGLARAYVRRLSRHAPIEDGAGGFVPVARTAVVVGFGLWFWGWGLLLSAGLGPIGIALFLPLAAVRGLVAPSWLARVGCTREAGLRALRSAFFDTTGQRLESLVVEGLVLSALFGIAANLFGVFAAIILLGRSFLGLDLALVESFLSMENTFVLLAVTVLAAALLEPLRAALAAALYVDARVRADGLDLQDALDAAIGARERRASERASSRSERARTAARVGLVAIVVSTTLGGVGLGASPIARAAPPSSDEAGAEHAEARGEASLERARDAEARARAATILAGDAFREDAPPRGESFTDLLVRVFEWLLAVFEGFEGPVGVQPMDAAWVSLPGPGVFLALGVVVLALVLALLVGSRRREAARARQGSPDVADRPEDPRERSPALWLAEADALAASERFGPALRALYFATLVALDRSGWIRFDASLTNWQYLAQLASGEARDDFRLLTRTFDAKFYGREPASVGDYEANRALAERIVLATSGPRGAATPRSGAAA